MQIGITRNFEPSQDLTVFYRLKDINILITKDLRNVVFQNLILKYSDKIILHCNCTGWGSTPAEPKIPHPATMYNNIVHLINSGFPKERIILRIDPIIPSEIGLNAFELVLSTFRNLGIKRCKISLLRMYKHITERPMFLEISTAVGCPYYSDIEDKIFYSPNNYQTQQVLDICKKYETDYTFEYCNLGHYKDTEYSIGCVSNKDLELFGINDVIINPSRIENSKCKCPTNIIELSQFKKQCNNKCLYCSRPNSKI